MTYTIWIILILFGISVVLGIVTAFLIKPVFMKIDPSKSEMENYLHIWNPECGISIVQTILLVVAVICIIISCVKGETLNDTSETWAPFFSGGILGGIVLGFLYYHFFRDPFMKKNLPEVSKAYEQKAFWRFHVWTTAVNFNFAVPLASTLGFIGILLAVLK